MNDITPASEATAATAAHPLGLSDAEVREATRSYDDETRDHVLWLHAFAAERGLGPAELAKALQVDRTTLHRVLRGTYKNAAGETVKPGALLKNAKALRRATVSRAGRVSVGFVPTQTAGYIHAICEAAARDKQMALIHGPSHTGKTWALREYARRTPGAYYLAVTPAGGFRSFVRDVAEAVGVKPDGHTHASLMRAVAAKLDDSAVLLVDEAHQITTTFSREQRVATLEWLRLVLHDGRGCGLVLCGTHVWADAIHTGKLAGLLTQVVRRGRELNLTAAPSEADVRALAEAHGFPSPKGEHRALLLRVAKEDGLKAVTTRLARALADAAEDGRAAEWADVLNADYTISLYRSGKIYEADKTAA